MQRPSKTSCAVNDSIKSEHIMSNNENEKIIPPLKLMTKNEVMDDLLKLLSLVQKHDDKRSCQHCLDLLESVFALKQDVTQISVP